MRILFTILLSAFVCATSFAQIPNSGFETWDSTAGYKVPVGWESLNATTASSSVYTCEYGMPGYSGGYYLNLMSKTIPGMGNQRGLAVAGKLAPGTQFPSPGFAFTQRPQVLAGYWQYMAMSLADQGYIITLLSKWNTALNKRDTIAYTKHDLYDMVMIWEPFKIALNYTSSDYPDSAMIVLSASGAGLGPIEDGSYLWVDDLKFGDSATLGSDVTTRMQSPVKVFPNPASDIANIYYRSNDGGDVKISVASMDGKMVMTLKTKTIRGENSIPLNIKELPHGIYSVKIEGEQSTEMRKLIIE